MLKNLRLITIFAVATLALAAPASAKTLKVGHSTWVGYGPFYIALEKGYYKEEGVDVEFVRMEDTPLKMGALLAGQIDMAASTADEFPTYLKPGKGFRYIVAVDFSKGGDGVVANKDITSVAGLKGKKVAFEQGSISQFFLNALLKEAGLTQADIEPVSMTAADAGTAFVAKQVDAAVTWEPALSLGAQSEHGHLLVSSAEKPDLIVDVVAVTPETLAAHSDELKGFVRAWYRALDYLKSNPDDAYAIMARGVGGWIEKPEEFKAVATGIEYLDKAKNEQLFGTDAARGPLFKTVGDAIEIWRGLGRIEVDVKPEDVIVTSHFGG